MQNKKLGSEALCQLNRLLPLEKQEHYNYQDLASLIQSLTGQELAVDYKHEQIPIDQERYPWIKDRIASIPKAESVVEVGGNLGYICLRLVNELGLRASCHEPIEDYMRISNFIAEELGLAHLYKGHATSVLWDNISELPEADVIVNLNVLHHAGRVFDCDVVREMGGWASYAQSYLEKLVHKGKYLFFQTGNTWPEKRLFENTEAPEYLASILRNSGWEVTHIGICSNLPNLTISSYSLDQINSIPRIWCQRNRTTHLVDYYYQDKVVASFSTGLAQRPIFFCRSTK